MKINRKGRIADRSEEKHLLWTDTVDFVYGR
jgi:hypothetical protein